MLDRKFIYNHKTGFKLLPSVFCFHSSYIEKGDFDITVRGFVFYDKKLIYIRINPNEYIEKKLYILNLKNCLKYLKKEYPTYKIYDSYKIDKIPEDIKYLLA